MSTTASSKSLAKHRALRLAKHPTALSLEAVLDLADQLRTLAGDTPAVARLLDAITQWAIAKRDRRIADNTGLVFDAVRKRYKYALQTLGIPEADAQQEGMIGLLKGAMLYDESRAVAFSTYAFTWIRQAIGRHLEADTMVRGPGHIQRVARAVAKESGESCVNQRCLSLDLTWGEEEKNLASLAVDKSAPNVVRHSDACADLEPLLQSLRPKERLMIECRFLRNLTLDETAVELAKAGHTGCKPLTRERVRQLVGEVLGMMRARAKVLAVIQGKKRRGA